MGSLLVAQRWRKFTTFSMLNARLLLIGDLQRTLLHQIMMLLLNGKRAKKKKEKL